MEFIKKNISGGFKITILSCIIEAGSNVTSNSMIVNIMNSYFIVKITAIVSSFTMVIYDNLIFLKNLIVKPKSPLNLPPISMEKTEIIVNKKKLSFKRF